MLRTLIHVSILNIHCSGEGYDACPAVIDMDSDKRIGIDDIDKSYGELLVEHANNELLTTGSGSYSLTVCVESEPTPRLYRTTWSTSSSGGIRIKVFRDDI